MLDTFLELINIFLKNFTFPIPDQQIVKEGFVEIVLYFHVY